MKNMMSLMIAGAATAFWLTAIASPSVFGQAAPAAGKSLSDGVYSAAQAQRGQAVFETTCTACHDATRFTGDELLKTWSGKSLHDLFEVMSTTMPEDNPGGLKPQQYADVVAYFLKLNKFPAGEQELKAASDAMRAVKIEKK